MVPEFVARPGGSGLWGTCPSFPQTKNLEASIYGRQIRVAGGSKRLSALPTGEIAEKTQFAD